MQIAVFFGVVNILVIIAFYVGTRFVYQIAPLKPTLTLSPTV